MTAEIVTWLDTDQPASIAEAVRRWTAVESSAARAAVVLQGLGPWLHDALPGTPIYEALPVTFREGLAGAYAANYLRVSRLHDDLAAILRGAGRAGIAVMPLKGSLLSTSVYRVPALRPMADLDLLIRPGDAQAMAELLGSMGYEPLVAERVSGHNLKFIKPDNRKIVSWGVDHADNPRPVEVHIDLKSALWGHAGAFDLTDFIWAHSRSGEVLGEPACLPTAERSAVYLAAHAFRHHLVRRARAIQWLDLALAVPQTLELDPPDVNWVYPVLRLAARALPRRLSEAGWAHLAGRTQPRLRRWAESVPLDGRCGLNVDTLPMTYGRVWARWKRWQPTSWRLALAYPNTPVPLGYVRYLWAVTHYLAAIGRYLWRRASHQS